MQTNQTLESVLNLLPLKCVIYDPSKDLVGLVTKGLKGYAPMFHAKKTLVEQFSVENGLSKSVVKAMEYGSNNGWDNVEGLNPENYN